MNHWANRRGLTLVTLVLGASMGPYLTSGIRTEQAVVYAVASVAILLVGPVVRPVREVALLMVLWGLYLFIVLLGAVDPPVNVSGYASALPLAGLDNAALPLAAMIIVVALMRLGANPVAGQTDHNNGDCLDAAQHRRGNDTAAVGL